MKYKWKMLKTKPNVRVIIVIKNSLNSPFKILMGEKIRSSNMLSSRST